MCIFLHDQGYPVELSKIAQDNKVAQLLETRGKFSSMRRTKHIKNKVFFVKDQVDQGEIAIVDCTTGTMWADFFSNPQQDARFKDMRAVVMGCDVECVDPLDLAPKSTEQVGELFTPILSFDKSQGTNCLVFTAGVCWVAWREQY